MHFIIYIDKQMNRERIINTRTVGIISRKKSNSNGHKQTQTMERKQYTVIALCAGVGVD